MVFPTKRVAVVGAGISGVVAAAHLRNEGIDVTVFERSSVAGGIWVFDEEKPLEPAYPPAPVSKAATTYTADSRETERLIHAPPGPCYIGLKNNVSTPLLETTLHNFPEGTSDFVSHEVLQRYIRDTSIKTGVHAITKYDTEVRNVSKSGDKWEVSVTTLRIDGAGSSFRMSERQKFDAVVVASGHYHAPKVPDTPGLADWKRLWPDRVQHSKGYRRPYNARGKNFLLIGGSVSSTDIARELGPFANKIYQSHRNGLFDLTAGLLPENGYRVEEVVSYDAPEALTNSSLNASNHIPATITLETGQKLCDIDYVILCTGYHLTVPFLPDLHSDGTPVDAADEKLLVTDGSQFHNLHKDMFYMNDPTLAFVGVPFFTATFTLFEFQAMVVARVFSGQVALPSSKNMRLEYEERVRTKGYGKRFHSLKDKEVEYVNELLNWVNNDLEKAGKETIHGHTARWHAAKQEQVARITALFAAPTVEKHLVVDCP